MSPSINEAYCFYEQWLADISRIPNVTVVTLTEREDSAMTTYMQIDRKSPRIMEAIGAGALYKKQGTVQARHATPGEKIVTTLANGTKETSNSAKEGDMIVTNPSGEQYIVSSAKFQQRYESTSDAGVYASRGHVRAIRNPFGEPITAMASWGEQQTGGSDCWIVDTCDALGENLGGEPYLIDGAAFEQTYKPRV